MRACPQLLYRFMLKQLNISAYVPIGEPFSTLIGLYFRSTWEAWKLPVHRRDSRPIKSECQDGTQASVCTYLSSQVHTMLRTMIFFGFFLRLLMACGTLVPWPGIPTWTPELEALECCQESHFNLVYRCLALPPLHGVNSFSAFKSYFKGHFLGELFSEFCSYGRISFLLQNFCKYLY